MTDYSKAYHYDTDGYFDEVINCQIDPLASAATGETVYLLPSDSTYQEPLPAKEGYKIKFNGSIWIYEEIPHDPEPPAPTPEDIIRQEIYELKNELTETDYKIIKCSEYSLNGQDLPYDIAELHAERQALRDRINELEELLPQCEAE